MAEIMVNKCVILWTCWVFYELHTLITVDLSKSACDGIISTVNKEEGGHAIFP